jgi:hypothetical protein
MALSAALQVSQVEMPYRIMDQVTGLELGYDPYGKKQVILPVCFATGLKVTPGRG